MKEKRGDTRFKLQGEKYGRFFIKRDNLKEKVKLINISRSGLLYELPKSIDAMDVGDIAVFLFQAGDETSTFSVTIRWASDYFKSTKQKEYRRYGAQINHATFTNQDLWHDYVKYITLRKRFSVPAASNTVN